MAILNQIRQRSLFLILVIAMALFSFVLADVIRNASGSSLPDQNIIATINGIEMEREDFMKKVENLERQNRGSGTNVQSMNYVLIKDSWTQGEGDSFLSAVKHIIREETTGNLITYFFANANGCAVQPGDLVTVYWKVLYL